MTSPFDELDAELSAAVLTAYGEAAAIVPRRGGQYAAPGFDPERSSGPVPVMGVFTATPEVSVFGSADGQVVVNGRTITADAILWLSKAQVAAIGFQIKRDDQIIMEAQTGKPTYTVVAPAMTELGDTQLFLVKDQ
jgi:hypothetical protein